jgi:formate-nitrite transporter family protein
MASNDRSRLTLPAGERDHTRGADDAPVTLLEYGDFECPQCVRAFPIIGRIQQAFAGRLRFVFRHFPLTNSHPQAQHAAEAAEWAATRGAFWEMHDALYTASPALADEQILQRAAALRLPAAELRTAWASHTFIPRVKEDFRSGLDSGVTGTPAFFINGVRHDGLWDEDSLTIALDRAG